MPCVGRWDTPVLEGGNRLLCVNYWSPVRSWTSEVSLLQIYSTVSRSSFEWPLTTCNNCGVCAFDFISRVKYLNPWPKCSYVSSCQKSQLIKSSTGWPLGNCHVCYTTVFMCFRNVTPLLRKLGQSWKCGNLLYEECSSWQTDCPLTFPVATRRLILLSKNKASVLFMYPSEQLVD